MRLLWRRGWVPTPLSWFQRPEHLPLCYPSIYWQGQWDSNPHWVNFKSTLSTSWSIPPQAYWGQGATPESSQTNQFKMFHGILPFSDTRLPTLGISSSTDQNILYLINNQLLLFPARLCVWYCLEGHDSLLAVCCMPQSTAGAGCLPVIGYTSGSFLYSYKLVSRSHTLSRLDLRTGRSWLFPGVFTIKVGRERQKGERIIPFSLPTLYIYYTTNLIKSQNLSFLGIGKIYPTGAIFQLAPVSIFVNDSKFLTLSGRALDFILSRTWAGANV